jgi:pyruvate kinase
MSVRHTKIVATLGPSSSDSAVIRELIIAGVNVFRLNFSHGSHDSHQRLIEIIREQSEQLGEPIAILQDLCGPKIRVSALPKNESMSLVRGQEVEIVEHHSGEVAERQIGVSLEGIANDLRADEPVLLDDGHFELVVLSCDTAKRSVRCRVVHGGLLKMKKGVNFPKSSLSVPSVTEKDLADLKFGMEQDLDFVALSFVRHEDEIKALRKRIQDAGKKIRIIAKIEKGEAIERIKQVIEASDGIMVARGDLGVELPVTRVPAIQKDLIAEAVRQDRFVITATQMLESMTLSPRADAS